MQTQAKTGTEILYAQMHNDTRHLQAQTVTNREIYTDILKRFADLDRDR